MGRSKDIASGSKFVDTTGDTMTGDLVVSKTSGATINVNTALNGATSKVILHEGTTASPANGATLEYNGSTNVFSVGVGSDISTKRLSIGRDTGAVTMPYQPAFKAYAGGGWQSFGNTNNNLMPFDTTQHNVGNHYNTSTKRFTAPVAGVYFFHGQWYSDGNTFGELLIRQNGSAEKAFARSNSQAVTVQTSVTLSLSVNDYIEMFGKISNTDTTDWYAFRSYSFFCGYLIG